MNLKNAPFFLSEAECVQIETVLSEMTDREKIGQLFCVMGGDYSEENLLEMVKNGRVGGILFRPEPAAKIRERYAPLDAAARIPLLKAANLEEGGSGGCSDGTLVGWPMLAAATADSETARDFGKVCGSEGAAVGINWSFSPVCDLNLNYQNPITNVRTFGSDQQLVEQMTLAYVEGLESQGVTACAKHFPGDGVDYRDQHLHPTVNSLGASEWYDSYGKIYRNLIDHNLMSIMVGHIAQPNVALDADPSLSTRQAYLPATLSPVLLQKVLREKLGFEGLITTDATIMGGYTTAMARKDALAASIMAGCDMLVFNTDFEEDEQYLLEAVADGRLTMQRLDDAVRRILALKCRVCSPAVSPQKTDGKKVHQIAADRAITLVKNTSPEVFPVTPERYPEILLIGLGQDRIADGSMTEIARQYLTEQGFHVSVYDREADDLHGTSRLPDNRLTLYLANFEQYSNQTTIRISWSPKHALDVPRFCNEEASIFVSLANPYHLQDVPRVRTYINAYTATRDTIRLTIDKLMGRSAFAGISPVDAFCGLCDTRL